MLHFVTVFHRVQGSPIAAIGGRFELESRVLLLFVAFIACLVLVIILVLLSRSHFQEQRRRNSSDSTTQELIQESPKSPIQTGAPLNSHSLPLNEQSDSEDSDGADKNKYEQNLFRSIST